MEHIATSYRNTKLDQKIVQNRKTIQKLSSDLKESEVSNNNLLQRYFIYIFKNTSPFTFHLRIYHSLLAYSFKTEMPKFEEKKKWSSNR